MELASVGVQVNQIQSSRILAQFGNGDSEGFFVKEETSFQSVAATVNISKPENPGPFALEAIINKINEILRPQLGENAVQNSLGTDFSPEATAERIVNLATGFFGLYQQQNPDEAPDSALSNFLSTIRDAIDEGFEEAREILTSLRALTDEISNTIDETYDLVQQGLDRFEQEQTANLAVTV